MRAPALAVAALIVASLLVPSISAEDFADTSKVSQLIRIQNTPQLAPGDSGRLDFYFNSTYTDPISDVRLNASIYHYATIDESVAVDSSWPFAYPQIVGSTSADRREWVWTAPTVASGESDSLNFTILTAASSDDMPHGSIFSQSSYFVRFWLEFNATVGANVTRFRMVSVGFFTGAQWDAAGVPTSECTLPDCRGDVNLTMLAGFLGVNRIDGIIPDTAFGVKEPIPRWPFYLLIVLAAFFLVLAFLFWVEENPGAYPRIETWWARTRGRIARTIPPLRRKRAPKA